MANKEINVFSVSFLDLLSGALAAVIILFIIVPKATREQVAKLEQVDKMEVQVDQMKDQVAQMESQVAQMDSLMARLSRSVPQDQFASLQEQMAQLQAQLAEITATAEQLRLEAQALRQDAALLKEQNANLQKQLRSKNTEIESLKRRIAELNKGGKSGNSSGSGAKIFGLNADFGIVCMWPEKDVDIDILVKCQGQSRVCCFSDKTTPFGNLMEDVRERADANDDRYELFYQSTVRPGRYTVSVKLFVDPNATGAKTTSTVDCYAILYPGTGKEVKKTFARTQINIKNKDYVVATFDLTENEIKLVP